MISSSNTLACKRSNKVLKKILLVSLMAVWVLSGSLMGNALADDLKTPAMDVNAINTGDTAWVLISSALVLLMTPGLAFFMAV